MLPFLPISEELLPKEWIKEEYPVLAQVTLFDDIKVVISRQAYTRTEPALSEGWKGYMIMAQAIIDPATAWSDALQLTSYDGGNTRSNTLYWIASREGAV